MARQPNDPGTQRYWYDKPAGKIAIGVIVGLLIWFATRILSQRDTPPPVVIQIPATTEPKAEEKATQTELAKPRRPAVQRTEDGKERDKPDKPDPP